RPSSLNENRLLSLFETTNRSSSIVNSFPLRREASINFSTGVQPASSNSMPIFSGWWRRTRLRNLLIFTTRLFIETSCAFQRFTQGWIFFHPRPGHCAEHGCNRRSNIFVIYHAASDYSGLIRKCADRFQLALDRHQVEFVLKLGLLNRR